MSCEKHSWVDGATTWCKICGAVKGYEHLPRSKPDPSAPKPLGDGVPFQKAGQFFYDGMLTKSNEALLNLNDELKAEISRLNSKPDAWQVDDAILALTRERDELRAALVKAASWLQAVEPNSQQSADELESLDKQILQALKEGSS